MDAVYGKIIIRAADSGTLGETCALRLPRHLVGNRWLPSHPISEQEDGIHKSDGD